jgi:hypothetical protein
MIISTAPFSRIVNRIALRLREPPRMIASAYTYCTIGHAGSVPVHNPGFVLDDGILTVGASLLARIAERRLSGA